MSSPDPATRPRVLVWAHRCWLLSGALLVLLGIAFVVLGFVIDGSTIEPVGIGLLTALVGAAYLLMSTRVFAGDLRWRSSLAALTLVAVIMLLIVSFVWNVVALALLAAIIGLFGSLLAFRPESDAWFTGVEPTTPPRSADARRKRGRR